MENANEGEKSSKRDSGVGASPPAAETENDEIGKAAKGTYCSDHSICTEPNYFNL